MMSITKLPQRLNGFQASSTCWESGRISGCAYLTREQNLKSASTRQSTSPTSSASRFDPCQTYRLASHAEGQSVVKIWDTRKLWRPICQVDVGASISSGMGDSSTWIVVRYIS